MKQVYSQQYNSAGLRDHVVSCEPMTVRSNLVRGSKVKQYLYRPGGPEGSRRLRLPDFKTGNTLKWQGCQPYALAAFTPQEIFLVLISVRD
jgi:hypothetical protein